jgi:hypothetical protein
MSLSRRSIDMLMDLIENRIACMQVVDREDHRQLAILTQARQEIITLTSQVRREAKAALAGEGEQPAVVPAPVSPNR